MTTPYTPAQTRPGLQRPRPSLANTPAFARENTLPPPTDNFGSPLLSPASMLARKASFNQLTQNSLASIPDASAGYGLSGRPGHRGVADDIEVGDLVNTPGGMYGTVKFIGNVKGKAGIFIGVELEPELAGKGKNDGAVDGVRYFTTSSPSSGVFVPFSRATKRLSVSSSPPPPTPTLTSPSGPSALHPPSYTPNRDRSESPSGRAYPSSIGKPPPGRPSIPRSESPVRRSTPGPGPRPTLLPPATPRNVSSAAGGRFGAPSPTPGKLRGRTNSISSTNGGPDGRPGTASGGRYAQTPKHPGHSLGFNKTRGPGGMRSGSALGIRSGSSMDRHREDQDDTSSPIDSGISLTRSDDYENGGMAVVLQQKIEEKDRQLQEQAASLLEMEASLGELQSLVVNASSPTSHVNSPLSGTRSSSFEDADAPQLRSLLREKNEKIHILTVEFDAHRADFRSTIDTLELASTETERVYEKRVEDLLAEIRELQERNEDVESVARQLKQLEELVAELEEGLEDARRGEAEARGEVEFLRGEVERSREELRREREKNSTSANGKMMRSGSSQNDEVEKKDDEIRGLKAIIHSLSRDAITADDVPNGLSDSALEKSIGLSNGVRRALNATVVVDGEELVKERTTRERLEKEVADLEGFIERKVFREEELEKEIDLLRKRKETRNSSASAQSHSTGFGSGASSEKTVIGTPTWSTRPNGEPPKRDSGRDSRGTIGSWRSRHRATSSTSLQQLENSINEDVGSGSGGLTPITAEDSDTDSSALWCEICETAGHDILTCTNMFGSAAGGPASAGPEGEKRPYVHEDRGSGASSPVDGDMATPNIGTSDDEYKMAVAEKKKSVHLPPPPPMVGSGEGAVAGKESGVVDMNKWCALCERDGHDSVDCPLDTEF